MFIHYINQIIFTEIEKSIILNNFVNYIGYYIVKTMASLQFYRLLLFIGGTGTIYIFSKYVKYRLNTILSLNIVNTLCNLTQQLINAINNNQDLSIVYKWI